MRDRRRITATLAGQPRASAHRVPRRRRQPPWRGGGGAGGGAAAEAGAAAAALSTMRAVLDEAGATLDNVAPVTACVPSVAARDPVYGQWDALFPDAQDRPPSKCWSQDCRTGRRS